MIDCHHNLPIIFQSLLFDQCRIRICVSKKEKEKECVCVINEVLSG